MRRLRIPLGLAAGLLTGGAASLAWLLIRLEVHGPSMIPTLGPGDRVVVLRLPALAITTFCGPGTIVACRDPREPALVLIKRVSALTASGQLEVHGDNPAASTDSREFGPLPPDLIIGPVVRIYARSV